MKFTVLIENSRKNTDLISEHGLSLFIETENHRILLDAGETGSFVNNAKTLGINLESVDTAILSHGHSDHGGGLNEFIKINSSARIYVKDSAFEIHENTSGKNIGIDINLKQYSNTVLISENIQIDEELFLFSNVSGRRLFPRGNLRMRVIRDGKPIQDDFIHEQYLVVKTEKGNVLFSGCAHNGIVNILDTYKSIFNDNPYAVISGFHLMNNTEMYVPYSEDDIKLIEDTARELASMNTRFFTGHCTGEEAYQIMKKIMPDNLHRLTTGLSVEL